MLLGILAAVAVAGGPGALEGRLREGLVAHHVLRDPISAEIMVKKGPWADTVTLVGQTQRGLFVCADVNAKNGFGAYIGFRPYMFILRDDGAVSVWARDGLDREADKLADDKCGTA